MKVSDKILTIIVTVLLALGGWMLKMQASVTVNSQSIIVYSEVVKEVSSSQAELKDVMHRLDKTLTKFEAEFVTRDQLSLQLKELKDEIRAMNTNSRP